METCDWAWAGIERDFKRRKDMAWRQGMGPIIHYQPDTLCML